MDGAAETGPPTPPPTVYVPECPDNSGFLAKWGTTCQAAAEVFKIDPHPNAQTDDFCETQYFKAKRNGQQLALGKGSLHLHCPVTCKYLGPYYCTGVTNDKG